MIQPRTQAVYSGRHVAGNGEASNHLGSYDDDFNCRMVGTFNIVLRDHFWAPPCFVTNDRQYWFVTISNETGLARDCWLTRDHGSCQSNKMMEAISKAPLPDEFKNTGLQLTVWYPWNEATARAWAKGQYWFQTFPWTPETKADSQFVWDHLKDATDWSGKRVLDIGGNAGFHAFKAAHLGAQVIVVEPSDETRDQGRMIARHIERQDVRFLESDPGGKWDVILYLSVHHQVDLSYGGLPETLIDLGKRAPEVFVELHVKPLDSVPPVHPIWTEAEIDAMFVERFVTYQSRMRGQRSLYRHNL